MAKMPYSSFPGFNSEGAYKKLEEFMNTHEQKAGTKWYPFPTRSFPSQFQTEVYANIDGDSDTLCYGTTPPRHLEETELDSAAVSDWDSILRLNFKPGKRTELLFFVRQHEYHSNPPYATDWFLPHIYDVEKARSAFEILLTTFRKTGSFNKDRLTVLFEEEI